MLDYHLYATCLYPRSNVVHNGITKNLLGRMSLIHPTSEDFSKLIHVLCIQNTKEKWIQFLDLLPISPVAVFQNQAKQRI